MKEAPKVLNEVKKLIGQGSQILLPFNIGDCRVTFDRWWLAEEIQKLLDNVGKD